MSVDAYAKMQALMRAQSAITNLVGTNIFTHGLPERFNYGPNIQSAIVIKDTIGGERMANSPVLRPVFLIQIYAKSTALIETIYLAVLDALDNKNNLTTPGARFIGLWVGQMGETDTDQDTRSPMKIFPLEAMLHGI